MKKQKALFLQFLLGLGFLETVDKNNPEQKDMKSATDIANELFPDDAQAEPALDAPAILASAQEWAKPFLEDHFKKELNPHFKGKFVNESLSQIVKASGGILKNSDITKETTVEALAKIYGDRIKSGMSATDQEKQTMIDELNKQLETKDADWQKKLEDTENTYKAKEEATMTKDAAIEYFGKKSIKVTPSVAFNGIFPMLNDKFAVKWDPNKKEFGLFDKSDPTKPAKKNATAFAKFDEEADSIIKEFQWNKDSQGGSGGGAGDGGKGSGQGGSGGGQRGGAGGEREVKQSPLGALLATEGAGAE